MDFFTITIQAGLEHAKVCDLMEVDGKGWDIDLVSDLFKARDRDLILRIPLSINTIKESWYWVYDEKGNFSVKSYYRALQGELSTQNSGIWRKIWALKVPPW